MTIRKIEHTKALWLLAVLLAGVGPVHAQLNYWTNSGSGFWSDSANWSAGLPNAGETIIITNSPAAEVFLDTSALSAMTVSNLLFNDYILIFSDAGTNPPLHILNTFNLQSTFYQTNSVLQVDGPMILDGDYDFLSGYASISNLAVGNNPVYGQLQCNGGVMLISPGILTVGTETTNSNGHVDLEGGTLISTNGIMLIGGNGTGSIGLGSGAVFASGAQLGGPLASLFIGGGPTNASFYASQHILIGNDVDAVGSAYVSISDNGVLCVTNATQSAYIDVGASGSLTLSGGLLQVDNLILTNGGRFGNVSGTIICPRPYQVENNSSVSVNGGLITTATNFTLGASSDSLGTLVVADGGTLNVTNATLGIGNDGTLATGAGTGMVTVANGTINASTINLGSTAGGSGSLSLQSNGTVNVASNLTVVSGSLSSTSIVSVADATLSVTNGTIAIGSSGAGRMEISGTVTTKRLEVGGPAGAASGSVILLPGGRLISPSISANFVCGCGGDLDGSGGDVTIGENHDAEVDWNSGNALAATLHVGYTPGFTGTFVQTGGTVAVTNALIVGDCVNGALGLSTLMGGTLYVTNATQTAILDVRAGTFTLNPGATLVVDTLILTNPCGHFINLGGTLILKHKPILAPDLDADGDGQLNWQEALAGTDPLDPRSVFAMLSATVSNRDVRLSWTTEGGHSYVLQIGSSPGTGAFRDFSPVITVPGTGAGTTNYVLAGAATNGTAFYRVRLGP